MNLGGALPEGGGEKWTEQKYFDLLLHGPTWLGCSRLHAAHILRSYTAQFNCCRWLAARFVLLLILTHCSV